MTKSISYFDPEIQYLFNSRNPQFFFNNFKILINAIICINTNTILEEEN